MNGHYFCPKCDDVAFGQNCHTCSTETTFIPAPSPSTPSTPSTPVDPDWTRLAAEADAAAAPLARPARTPNFTAPPGWFEQLRAAAK